MTDPSTAYPTTKEEADLLHAIAFYDKGRKDWRSCECWSCRDNLCLRRLAQRASRQASRARKRRRGW